MYYLKIAIIIKNENLIFLINQVIIVTIIRFNPIQNPMKSI